MDGKGLKFDDQKLDWHSFPLETLEGVIKVAMAGCVKYQRFNCLKPFDNGDQRFFSAAMRHLVACQLDPLAIDEETGCFHSDQAAWNLIMRAYHARKETLKKYQNRVD
jgi:hypothetical protein